MLEESNQEDKSIFYLLGKLRANIGELKSSYHIHYDTSSEDIILTVKHSKEESYKAAKDDRELIDAFNKFHKEFLEYDYGYYLDYEILKKLRITLVEKK